MLGLGWSSTIFRKCVVAIIRCLRLRQLMVAPEYGCKCSPAAIWTMYSFKYYLATFWTMYGCSVQLQLFNGYVSDNMFTFWRMHGYKHSVATFWTMFGRRYLLVTFSTMYGCIHSLATCWTRLLFFRMWPSVLKSPVTDLKTIQNIKNTLEI